MEVNLRPDYTATGTKGRDPSDYKSEARTSKRIWSTPPTAEKKEHLSALRMKDGAAMISARIQIDFEVDDALVLCDIKVKSFCTAEIIMEHPITKEAFIFREYKGSVRHKKLSRFLKEREG